MLFCTFWNALEFNNSKIQVKKLQMYSVPPSSHSSPSSPEVKYTFFSLITFQRKLTSKGEKIVIYTSLVTLTECSELNITFWCRHVCNYLTQQILLVPHCRQKVNISEKLFCPPCHILVVNFLEKLEKFIKKIG